MRIGDKRPRNRQGFRHRGNWVLARAMPNERIQRQIDSLLGETEAALTRLDWVDVRARANAVLALDPEHSDARSFPDAADRMGAASVPAVPAEPAAAASSQERRQVTVLSSDLSRFTALSERLDPDDVARRHAAQSSTRSRSCSSSAKSATRPGSTSRRRSRFCPMGDSVGMRNCRALLATLDQK